LPRSHPVRRALSSVRLAGARSTAWDATPRALAAIALAADLALADREAEAALLAVPMVSWREARDRDPGPGGAPLIRLGPDGAPAFQFDAAGRPVPVVLEINRLLGADTDPWGAADWWLGANAWLAGVPAALLGDVDDRVLVLAARAELAVD
ncbi:MAG TPA: hypothetical protein VFV01_36330, partial [Spirillospora sp.]|nr:hypothetical protein [Spirillospora sp.]